MKKVAGGVTTYYVGNHYEVTNNVATKYYSFGKQRVAMRVGANSPIYLHSDHLGSTSATSGASVSAQTYYAYGNIRSTMGSVPTDFGFTGQRRDASAGLMYYGARYYDSALGRFIGADTIVPTDLDPQTLNRYTYTQNNPVRFIDPSGHAETCGQGEICGLYTDSYPVLLHGSMSLTEIYAKYGVTVNEFDELVAVNRDPNFGTVAWFEEVAPLWNGSYGWTSDGMPHHASPFEIIGMGVGLDALNGHNNNTGKLVQQAAIEAGPSFIAAAIDIFGRDRKLGKMTERPSGWPKGLKSRVLSKAPTDEDGNKICPGCGRVIDENTVSPDHFPTLAWRKANRTYATRTQFLEDYYSIRELRPLCLPCNISHFWENTPTELLPYYRRE